ncbi:ISAs1 family transposase [Gemmata sp. JC717]|uniref:ISAs1 family transposase n=1 Tax=Gemmata algarum TaxID=2975278 RepID=UPI0021BB84B2|nr:ISAs1 family transposase [Gemmata algarum]MDY3557058.1 ISAs1 family transposase [Gemmata algarum]
MPARSLYEELSTIPDPRGLQGRIHPLPAVLGLVAVAVLMGRTGLQGIARFGRQYGTPLAHARGFRSGQTPSASTRSRTLRRIDPQQLEAALGRWITGPLDPAGPAHVVPDGQCRPGSRDGDVPGQHRVAAYAPHAAAVLGQVRVDAKTNEHTAALALLGVVPVGGAVFAGDAMFGPRDVAAAVVDGRGHYVRVAKDNQPGLVADIEAGLGFEDTARGLAAATSP